MMTVREVSRLTGVTVRALQYYDRLGLLPPAQVTAAGYRLYDRASLERLQQILLLRELEFPLREIKRILDSPAFDRETALEQQIALLTMKKERLERLIALAHGMRTKEGDPLKFDAFDTKKIDAYAAQAKEAWGGTAAWREYEEKSAGRTGEQARALGAELMDVFTEFAAVRDEGPASPAAQALVRKLQAFITGHYYECTKEILRGLGAMYAAGGEMTDNIDAHAGAGTADFAARAIEAYCAAGE